MKVFFLLLSLLLASCATQTPLPTPINRDVDVTIVDSKPEMVVVPSPAKVYKTPRYKFSDTITPDYFQAVEYIEKWANSDEFIHYVLSKRTYYSNTTYSVKEAIKLWREQLNQNDIIPIAFYTPLIKGKAIGGWDGYKINQNTKYVLSAMHRAGHLIHETSHKYGWKHNGNKVKANNNVNSFPYAIGYDFEDFLIMKYKHLAGN